MLNNDKISNTNTEFKDCECGCGELIPRLDKYRRVERHYKNGHNTKGKNNPLWKGGKVFHERGYPMILRENRIKGKGSFYRLEHIVVYETHYKCCVLKWGCVHHIDGNKSNNNIDNLEGMTRSKHSRIHNKGNDYRKQHLSKLHVFSSSV